MESNKIDGNVLKSIFINAAQNLENNKQEVDDLNVFPVPDGDTGTNMSLTIQYAADEVKRSSQTRLSEVADIASNGALMGARGNSGVILSQLFRGFAKACTGKSELDIKGLADAIQESANMAYKAVMRPIEGTILTVAREMAEFAMENHNNYLLIDEMLLDVIKHGREALDNTPELLPVLKEAGVVDAGGMGLIYIVEGAYEVISGKSVPVEVKEDINSDRKMFDDNIVTAEDITFGYCTEFIILKNSEDAVHSLRENLTAIGDSVIVIGGEDITKVHVHTDNPDQAIKWALAIGPLTRIKIDNMREEVAANPAQQEREKQKPFGFITVASGDGLEELFANLGVDEVIQGGQTMNPSTQDFLSRIDAINAEVIYIFPNNSNILLAANQAKEISDKKIVVIPTKSIPQGITALLTFNEENTISENEANMTEAIKTVKTGQITYAVRDTSYNSIEIKKDDIIGIIDGEIESVGSDIYQVLGNIIEEMADENSSLISVYYGSDVDEDKISEFMEIIEEKYNDFDVEANNGGQNLYYFIVSVE